MIAFIVRLNVILNAELDHSVTLNFSVLKKIRSFMRFGMSSHIRVEMWVATSQIKLNLSQFVSFSLSY